MPDRVALTAQKPIAKGQFSFGTMAAQRGSMHNDSSVLDEIIYARVLITLQRMQLDEQDRKLRDHLAAIIGNEVDATLECQESLKRAWQRASETLGISDGTSDNAGSIPRIGLAA